MTRAEAVVPGPAVALCAALGVLQGTSPPRVSPLLVALAVLAVSAHALGGRAGGRSAGGGPPQLLAKPGAHGREVAGGTVRNRGGGTAPSRLRSRGPPPPTRPRPSLRPVLP